MKRIKRKQFLSNIRAFSPVISALLLIIIVVASGVVVYAFIMGWIGGATKDLGFDLGLLSLEGAYATETQITAYVRNDGSESVTVDCAYVEGTRIYIDDVTIAPHGVESIRISGTYTDGQSYEIKIACKNGGLLPFNVKCSASGLSAYFGDGSDGTLTVSSADSIVNDYAYLTGNENSGDTMITISGTTGFNAEDEILIIQVQNSSNGEAGTYEFKHIASISGNNITLSSALENNYYSGALDRVGATASQIVRVPQYTTVTVNPGCSITAPAWNGYTGGIVVFRATGIVTVKSGGSIDASEKGYRGGAYGPGYNQDGYQGESYLGKGIGGNGYGTGRMNNAGGGGSYICGGGGEYGGGATNSDPWTGSGDTYARKGTTYGTPDLSKIFFGSGGGGQWDGADTYGPPSDGGDGGGTIIVYASSIVAETSSFLSNGETTSGIQAGSYTYGSSGGAGGSIFLCAIEIHGANDFCRAVGGSGNHAPIRDGGDGGVGRIRLDYNILNGTTSPSPGYTGSIS